MQITVRDAARLLNVSEKMIYRWIGEGSIPAIRVNEQYRFNRAELLEWATAQKIQVSAEIFQEPETDSGPLPGLEEALRAGGIHFRVAGTDLASVLREVVRIMPLADEVDREFLFQVFLARENLGSTAIGEGIAIPHVRNPIVLHVDRPMISLCFLTQAVDFKALDRMPVHVLFTLVSPTVRAHLHLLSRLAHALRAPAFKDAVLRQATPEELLREAGRVDAAVSKPGGSAGEQSAS